MNFNRIISLFVAALLVLSSVSCGKNDNPSSQESGQNITPNADNTITMPEGEDKAEEIIINENYADSELFVFTGTVDEIYEDGSILVYSPDFRVNYNYTVIVEFDENSVIDGFVPKENQHIKFEVYSAVKKSEPLTVVASKLSLLNEVSTQREEEAERIAKLEEKVQALINEKSPEAEAKNVTAEK